MASIRIVTDSTADIPQELRERYRIEMIPLKVHFGNDMYQDAVTISAERFYQLLVEAKRLPTTSQPSPIEFLEVFKRLNAEPDTQIISIHLSASFSGTYQSAVLAKNMMEEESDITIVDSKSASYGFGLIVVEAAKMAEAGRTKEEILAMIERYQRERKLFFLVDTLEYLQKGGRIGKAAALFGTLLNIKPILSIDDEGEVYAVEKVRGHKKAVARILEMLKQQFEGRPVHTVMGYTSNPSAADELAAAIQNTLDVRSMDYTIVGSVIGTHVGTGVAAVFMWPADEASS
ncbi:DegV family protein [Paenibacillus thiaminolyticus]|uniref:DegV family protein n=1 Tax=Paenibacillus thiaminolyticus TaxID=49283 RepID=A0AAP9DYL8_PANTH|nr:DegV family protein [Paenibacillus thiaminolyticus]MCY9534487.1 DegV family protein [Paenibacillus thiaminolyticus]MCY9601297.1 DegV family protein [Paenibacillus thiaminolyticus]MCY9606473.1 DegV family protein [Paenibacillus thiaminolyticus]MCY9614073.1 DegV family protein [Paenibacillus thiaminolyticus]MCY9618610.1 DegV family protein [Paenibacillus thiaminolyticus]